MSRVRAKCKIHRGGGGGEPGEPQFSHFAVYSNFQITSCLEMIQICTWSKWKSLLSDLSGTLENIFGFASLLTCHRPTRLHDMQIVCRNLERGLQKGGPRLAASNWCPRQTLQSAPHLPHFCHHCLLLQSCLCEQDWEKNMTTHIIWDLRPPPRFTLPWF